MTRKVITREELEQFLRKHKLWLENEGGGERADLRGADLRYANLGGADLGGADLGEEWGKLEKSTDIFIAGPLGSRNGYTTFFHTDKGIFVQCGCFRGTLEEFTAKVKETHNNNEHARNYLAIAEFVKQKHQ